MAAEIAEPGPGEWADGSFPARLAAARAAVADLAAAAGELCDVPDDDVADVMGELTTLVGRLDGLRVAVTAQVRERGLWRLRGASTVAGWLRADPRTTDVAWSLSRMATMGAELPKLTGMLSDGSASLTQAGTVCWQVSQLPDTPQPPQTDEERPRPAGSDSGSDPGSGSGDDLWAGIWRSGNVHAAADELFANFLPGLNSQQLRILGAHLREAADVQERAGEDYDAFAKRALRISRSFGGVGELSGRLHPEAAEQVIAAFEELGAKAGPGDTRTKAQRWADALAHLVGLAGLTPAAPPAPPSPAAPDPVTPPAGPRAPDTEPGDDEPSADGGHGHAPTPTPGAADEPPSRSSHPAATGTGTAAPSGLRRPRVIVTVPLATLLGEPLAPGAVLGAGTPITGEAARRLSCDAEIIRLVTGQAPGLLSQPAAAAGGSATDKLTRLLTEAIASLPRPLGGPSALLDIGRKSQSWTPRQRDALYAQYGGRCGAPGCTRRIDVIHHIIHWLYGGRTQVINGAPFCNFDHWRVHEGGWQVRKEPDGTLVMIPPPRGWRPGTIYRHGKPLPETITDTTGFTR